MTPRITPEAQTTTAAAAHAHDGTLADALARAAGRVVGEAHDAKNQHHGYRYTSAEAVIAGARRVLAAEGVTAHVTSWGVAWGWGGDVAPEAREWAAGIGRLVLSVARGAESISLTREWPVMVGKGRPADKGAAGAETQALAYALRGLLLIDRPEEEDTAVDRRDDRDYQPPAKSPPKREPPPPPRPMADRAPEEKLPPKPVAAPKPSVTWPPHVMALVEEAKRLGLAKADVEQAAREVGVQPRALTPEQCTEIVALWRMHAKEAAR
jgi:hypothetical protein